MPIHILTVNSMYSPNYNKCLIMYEHSEGIEVALLFDLVIFLSLDVFSWSSAFSPTSIARYFAGWMSGMDSV